MSIVLTRPQQTGRHRRGRAGLVPVTALITVVRRGFFASFYRPGRHRRPADTVERLKPSRIPVPAVG